MYCRVSLRNFALHGSPPALCSARASTQPGRNAGLGLAMAAHPSSSLDDEVSASTDESQIITAAEEGKLVEDESKYEGDTAHRLA